MAALKHDEQGFLVGTPIELRAVAKSLDSIREDVRAIRHAVVAPGATAARVAKIGQGRAANDPVSRLDKVATPIRGGESGIRSRQETAAVAAEVARKIAATNRAVATPASRASKRDSQGRFVANGRNGDSSVAGSAADGVSDGAVRSFAGRLSSAVLNSSGGMEEVDPAIKAFNEVAQPMAKGYELMTGGSEDKKQTGLLRRIFSKLNIFHKEETALEKANAKTLKAIEGNALGGVTSDSGFVGKVLAQLVSQIPLLGTALTGGKAALLGLKGLGGAALRGLGGIGGLLKGGGKGFLKRIPMLGTLLGGMFAWNEASAADADSSLTDDERRGKKGAAWGGAGGAAIGAAIGTVLLGPLGTIIGGLVGDWLGGQLGEIVGTHWRTTTDYIASTWDSCTGFFRDTWTSISSKFADITDWVGERWGKAKGAVSDAYDAAKQNKYAGPVIEKAETLLKKAGDIAVDAKNAAVGLVVAAKDKTVAAVSSGADYVANNTLIGRGAKAAYGAVVQAGKGFTTVKREDGSLEKREGARNWRNNNPGNIEHGEFAKKYGAIGSDGRFAVFPSEEAGRRAQEALIFEGKNYRDKTLADAISRYAPSSENDTAKYQQIALAAVGGQNKRMAEYSPAERAAILDAMKKHEGYKAGRITTLATAPASPAVANASAPKAPAMSATPAVSEAPPIIDPMASTGGKSVAVSVSPPDAGQDVKDRRIGHITTGGIA